MEEISQDNLRPTEDCGTMSSSAEEVKRDNADADGNMKHSGKMQIKCSQEGKSAVAKKKQKTNRRKGQRGKICEVLLQRSANYSQNLLHQR